MTNNTKRAVIMGATSGLGYEVARLLLTDGWKLGVAGRREDNLKKLQSEFPGKVCIKAIDVKDSNADKALLSLIDELGGMDMYFHSSGIGFQNTQLYADIELNTLETNGTGFTRLVGTAFRYFREKGEGHIAVISSIAGTKGLGVAPAYSATKRFQNTYIDALEQLAGIQKLNIRFTDIKTKSQKSNRQTLFRFRWMARQSAEMGTVIAPIDIGNIHCCFINCGT